jgi:hypothetical protein
LHADAGFGRKEAPVVAAVARVETAAFDDGRRLRRRGVPGFRRRIGRATGDGGEGKNPSKGHRARLLCVGLRPVKWSNLRFT